MLFSGRVPPSVDLKKTRRTQSCSNKRGRTSAVDTAEFLRVSQVATFKLSPLFAPCAFVDHLCRWHLRVTCACQEEGCGERGSVVKKAKGHLQSSHEIAAGLVQRINQMLCLWSRWHVCFDGRVQKAYGNSLTAARRSRDVVQRQPVEARC